MAGVSDDTYSISINGQQFLTALDERRVVLLPDGSERQLWQVRRTDKGGYTIRLDTTDRDLYLGMKENRTSSNPSSYYPTDGNGTSPTGHAKALSPSPPPEATNR
jgi:hypothetical protein